MRRFTPRTTTFRGAIAVRSEIEDAFPLFSPAGERSWVPGWDPEFVQPSDTAWEEGQIFRTREGKGDAVWIVTRLDRAQHHVEYHRVEPGRYVARITVTCRSSERSRTEVATTYTYIGLSEDGNREIAAMTQTDYDAKMARWTEWIDRHLEARARERRG